MANSAPFDGTVFLPAAPDVDQPHGNDYQEHQATKKSMEFVNNKEHEAIASPMSTSVGGGVHKNGSGVAYFTSTDPILRPDGLTALADNDVDKGRMLNDPGDVSNAAGLKGWDGSAWVNIGTPSGILSPYAGSSAPSGWLLCNGSTGLSTIANPEYLGLFSVIGTTYGGTSTTDFALPDMREASPVGVGQRASGVAAHDEYTLGRFKDDQFQGHGHEHRSSSAFDGFGQGGSGWKSNWTSSQQDQVNTGHVIGAAEESDGVPRDGSVTRGKRFGLNFIIKI